MDLSAAASAMNKHEARGQMHDHYRGNATFKIAIDLSLRSKEKNISLSSMS